VRAGAAGRAFSAGLNQRGRPGLPGYDAGLDNHWIRNPIGFFREARLTEAMKAVVTKSPDPSLEQLRRAYVRRLGLCIAVVVLGMPLL